ncbi:MAG: O-antigen ligase family protein [Campylobacterales bacterium]
MNSQATKTISTISTVLLLYGTVPYFIILNTLGLGSSSIVLAGVYIFLYLLIFLHGNTNKNVFFPTFGVIDLLFVLFCLNVGISYLLSNNTDAQHIRYFPFFVIAAYFAGRVAKIDFEIFIKTISFLGIASLLLYITALFYLNQNRDSFYGYNHFVLLFSQILDALILVTVFNVFRCKVITNYKFFIAIGIIFLSFLCMTMGVSKSGVLIGIVSIIVLTVAMPKKNTFIILGVFIAMLSGIIIGIQKPSSAGEFAKSISAASKPWELKDEDYYIHHNANSTALRMIYQKEAIDIFIQNPIFGKGADNIKTFPHSTVLHILAELGMIGFIVFSLFIAAVAYLLRLYLSKSKNENNRNTIIMLSTFFIIYLLDDQIHGHYMMSIHFFLCAGLLVNMIRQEGFKIAISKI